MPSLMEGGTWELFSDSILYPKEASKYKWAEGEILDVSGHTRNCNSLQFAPNGALLATGGDDKSARLFNTTDWRCTQKFDQGDGVVQLCWNPTGSTSLATLAADKVLRFWDVRWVSFLAALLLLLKGLVRSQKAVWQLKVSHEYINIAWTPDGATVAVGSSVGKDETGGVKDSVSLVDVATRKVSKKLKFSYEVNEFVWAPNSAHLLLTTEHGTVEVLSTDGEAYTMRAHTDDCYCLAIDAPAGRLAVGSKDSIVSIWDLPNLACIKTNARHITPVRCVAFSRDAEFLASSAYDPGIDIAETETGDLAYKLEAPCAMNSLAWHPSSLLLAYALDTKAGSTGTATAPAPAPDTTFIKLFKVPPPQ
ncbi:hypothetical protein CTAYLR_007534 [Chrysophaeum taylorii]|uniref:Anaphase-promoting complex subunit 4 WD40 domain-containing protein n=1 Tax=Chrysophaeum taylorii TaxID=2483200 RepID=A0AAD7UMV7_9STRA|nr:hypothetical protein CTAYLR_007534 [Chrysophaeum taylorii]